MIYLNDNNIILPNLFGANSSSYILLFHNNVTNEEFTQDASDISDNELYYSFVLDSSRMALNEYTVSLYDASSLLLGTFLAQKGISKANTSCFDNDTEYVQYEN